MILVLSLLSCSDSTAEAEQRDPIDLPDAPGVRVETAVLQPAEAAVELSLPAQVGASSDSTLAAPMGGYVEAVLTESGSSVRKGQVLARVDVRTRAAQREIAIAQAEQAEAELTRIRALGDGVSQQQLLAVETNARVARANADLAEIALQRGVIVAPFSGRVADVFVEVGEVAGPGAPVVRVVRTDIVSLQVSVNDRDVSQLEIGQEVEFRTQSIPEAFTGVVTNVGAAANTKTRTFTAEVEVANPDGALLPGMLGRIALRRILAEEAIVLPQDWIITALDSSGVFVDADGTAEWRELDISSFAADQAVITSGLEPGEAVVSVGGRDVSDGDALIVVRSGTCCENGQVVW